VSGLASDLPNSQANEQDNCSSGQQAIADVPRQQLDFLRVSVEIPVPPDFPDDSLVSAWRLRIFPRKSSASDDFLPK
jgi:hypothetical protein